jgi:Chaperone for flagella basal body P-ring formation
VIARYMFAPWLVVIFFAILGSSLFGAEAPASLSAERSMASDTMSGSGARPEVWRVVVSELRKQGVSETQLPGIEDLDLPPIIPALDGRKLRVASSCWDEGPRRTQFRLECSGSGRCLPFLVYVRASSDAGAHNGSCRLATSHAAREGLLKPAVLAGDRAMAIFRADRLRMTASVICLERGHEGEIIRVRGVDGHVFRARVSGPDQLEALPQ